MQCINHPGHDETRFDAPTRTLVVRMGFSMISCQLLLAAATVSAKWIVPGARWRDTKGDLVNAHAGGITIDQESGKFFWFGEYKIEGQVEGGGVSVYSSDDLVTWEPHGLALKPIEGHPYIDTHHIIQRPKVAYSEGTGKYHVSSLEDLFMLVADDI
jgi:hypothetical protein